MGNAHRQTFDLRAAGAAYAEMLDWMSFTPLENIAQARLCAVAALAGEWKLAREPALYATRLRRELFSPVTHLHFHHDIEKLLRGRDTEPAREGLRTFERHTRGQRG